MALTEAQKADLRQNAAAGAELLDAKGPWARYMSEDFSIKSSSRCALTQRFGSYDEGLVELNISNEEAWRRGFNLNPDHYYRDEISEVRLEAWRFLDECWVEEIRQRL